MKILENYILIIAMHISICYCFFKIINYKEKEKFKIKLTIITSIILLLAFLQSLFIIPDIFKLILLCFIYSVILGKLTNTKFENSIIVTIVSITISFIVTFLSASITLIIFGLAHKDYQNLLYILCDAFVILVLMFLLFRIKRLKNGFPFLMKSKNSLYLNTLILTVAITIIVTYFIIISFTTYIPSHHLFWGIIVFIIMLFVVLHQNFISYQTQKLQLKTLKEYEQELSDIKQKLSTALEEKQNLIKSNHEFYHRQEALNKKLDDLIIVTKSTNTEFGEEFGDIFDRINKLSDEYKVKTHTLPNLVKSNITEIDDMLSYMQLECYKNNIDFIVKIDCDMNHIISNYISKSKLETLLGDLIRNAIIAINHSSEEFRSILVVFGIKDDSYELCIYDSGIPFEINTLLNLGLKPSSTHLNEGGTGIGFITTFETINSCNASLIINESTNTQYTKSLEIKFDNKHEYVIVSNRKEEIMQLNNDNRNIVLI